MASIFHRQIVVLVMLLSLVGQVFATSSICMMNMDMTVDSSTSPCHEMMMEMASDSEQATSIVNCCDQMTNSESMMDSSCTCLDGSSSASLLLTFSVMSASEFSSDSIIIFSNSRFISQISSALFRPPIA